MNAVPANGGGAAWGLLIICPLDMTGGAIRIVVASNDGAERVRVKSPSLPRRLSRCRGYSGGERGARLSFWGKG